MFWELRQVRTFVEHELSPFLVLFVKNQRVMVSKGSSVYMRFISLVCENLPVVSMVVVVSFSSLARIFGEGGFFAVCFFVF